MSTIESEMETDLTEEEKALVHEVMLEAILNDSIRGALKKHPSIEKDSPVDGHLKQIWNAYRNIRLYNGDFMGLKISFQSAIDKESANNNLATLVDEFFKQLTSRNSLSVPKFYQCHKLRISVSKSTFCHHVAAKRKDKDYQVVLKARGSVKLLTPLMEMELVGWVYLCNHRGQAPSRDSIREKAIFLCRTNPTHWIAACKGNPKLGLESAEMLSKSVLSWS